MEGYDKITIIDDDTGEAREYDVICNFTYQPYGREYFVYTDHSEEDGILNLYVCYQALDDDSDEFIPVIDEEELAMVDEVIDAIME